MIEIITDRQIYEEVICRRIPKARKYIWIATANLKDMHVEKNGAFRPFLEVLSDLINKKVEVRLLHSREPGPAFRRDFDRFANLIGGMERILCPRVHFKTIIIDSEFAYTGSANLTGAGIGAKGENKRNFEAGIITDQPGLINKLAEQFDSIWRGIYCKQCGRKNYCADFKDILI